MKALLSIALAFVILLTSMGRVVICLGYQLNKEYIARVLCINKDNPRLQCHGKCHLKKQLQKAEDHEKKTGNSQEGKSEITWVTHGATSWLPKPILLSAALVFHAYQRGFFSAPPVGIFQPPKA